MNNLNRKIGVLILFLLLITMIVYTYIYKSHRNISIETPSFSVTSLTLINEFTLDFHVSSEKYLDKIIQIDGIVTKIENTLLVIDKSITCYFDEPVDNNLWLKKSITIKGRVLGYDELLEEVKIDQCIVITD